MKEKKPRAEVEFHNVNFAIHTVYRANKLEHFGLTFDLRLKFPFRIWSSMDRHEKNDRMLRVLF